MGSDIPKVLLPLCGRPMLTQVLDVLAEAGVDDRVIVVSRSGESQVRKVLGDSPVYVVQREQLGSGHAVMCAREAAEGSSNALVMCGDSPLFEPESVLRLMDEHVRTGAAITLASAILEDPAGYGRVLRDSAGKITGIVEECEAGDEQKAIREINGGCYAFDAGWLWDNIQCLSPNDAGEYCLTEIVNTAVAQGMHVSSVQVTADEVAGINTPEQLRQAEHILCARLNRA